MPTDDSVRHERELREQWEREHLRHHVLEARALTVARRDVNRRLRAMNELREQITQERGDYVERREHSQVKDEMDARLKALETQGSNMQGRMLSAGAIVALLVSLTMIALHFVKV